MPIYEYQCKACQHQFEVMQKMSDKPIKICPQCHSKQVSKLISISGFQLKGTGWYATDYKKPTADPAKTADSTKTDTAPKSEQQSTDKKEKAASKPQDSGQKS